MINLLAFLILNGLLITYLFSYSARINNPIRSSQYLMVEGTEMFLILLFATGTLSLSSAAGGHSAGGGLNLQSIRLLSLEGILFFSMFVTSERPQWSFGTIAYLIYLLWLIYSLTYAPSFNFGIRYILKYTYPFLVILTCSAIVRDEEVFLCICVWMRRLAIIANIFVIVPFLNKLLPTNFFWYTAAIMLNNVTISCTSFALYFHYGKDKKDLILAILFVFPTILSVHRSGILAMFIALSVFFFYKYKWLSLPYIAGVIAIGLAVVFYIPSVHEKMFWKDTKRSLTVQDLREGNIEEEDIRNNGRELIWTMLKSEFYEDHEMKGSGIGSCQKFLYENPALVKQTHGDYVQMRCDTGLIGMWLYIAVAIVIAIHCFIVCLIPYYPDYIKCCAMIAAAALLGNYAAMYSENVVTYTMASTGYPFGFYGIMLGLMSRIEKPKETLKANAL